MNALADPEKFVAEVGLLRQAIVRKRCTRRLGDSQMMNAPPCCRTPRCGDGGTGKVGMTGDERARGGTREQRRGQSQRDRQMTRADDERAQYPSESSRFWVSRRRRQRARGPAARHGSLHFAPAPSREAAQAGAGKGSRNVGFRVMPSDRHGTSRRNGRNAHRELPTARTRAAS
jgi:hypothetical protein